MKNAGAAGLVIAVGFISALSVVHVRAGGNNLPPAARGSSSQDGSGAAVIRFASNAAPVPVLRTKDLNGKLISSDAWSGKVTVVNFFATWCGPCREEIPELIALQKAYPQNVQVIGLSVDEGAPEMVKRFAERMRINYPVAMAPAPVVSAYGGIPALPTTYMVNREARIVQKHTGLYPEQVYDREVRALSGLPVNAKVETFQDVGQIFLKNAANATELPGVDMAHLSPAQKHAALHYMNARSCTCGCNLTIAQCRVNDSSCQTSLDLANDIIKKVSGASAQRAAAPPGQSK